MEQQNKYYTPDWNELHLGDIIECWHSYDIPRFEHDIFNGWEIDTLKKYLADGAMRVKYLDQSDIESCGWKHTGGQMISDGRQDYEKAGMMLKHFPRHNSLFIAKAIDPNVMDGFAEKLFDGECKSINELRFIQKLLGI